MKKSAIVCLLVFTGFMAFATTSPLPPAAPALRHVPSLTCTWIAFMPVILVALAIFICLIGLKNSDVTFSSLFAEKDTSKTTTLVRDGVTTETSPASTSRFIVFLTGLTGLILGSSITTIFIYQYFIDPTKPADLSNLTTVIFGLGIGVIPYGFNKIASGIKGN
jgi:uncharacterized membrane protein